MAEISVYAVSLPSVPVRFLPWKWRIWRTRLGRFILFSLAANLVGYSLVYILTSKGVGKWWANESVSKSMAPVGLGLNTLALTGQIRPTLGQATKWTAYWIPSAIVGAACTGLVIAEFSLGSLETRAVAGMMMFPCDYLVKRFIVFARQVRLGRFLFRQKFVLVCMGVLVWKRLSPLMAT